MSRTPVERTGQSWLKGERRDGFMNAPRKIIVYIATSADGYIARPDTVDYGMKAFYPTIDTVLWGRKTYDWALAYCRKHDMQGGIFDTKLANYVFSRNPRNRRRQGWNSCRSR